MVRMKTLGFAVLSLVSFASVSMASDREIDLRDHVYTVDGLDYLGLVARMKPFRMCWTEVGSVITMNMPEDECLEIESGAKGPDAKVTRWIETSRKVVSNEFLADPVELKCAQMQLAEAEKAIGKKKKYAETLKARGVDGVIGYVLDDYDGDFGKVEGGKVEIAELGDLEVLAISVVLDRRHRCSVTKAGAIAKRLDAMINPYSK